MKTYCRFLASLMMVALSILPALAGNTAFDNGPFNGTDNAYVISSGFAVSDSFYLGTTVQVDIVDVWVWEIPGDTMTSVQWQFTGGASVGARDRRGIADTTNSHGQGRLDDTLLVTYPGYEIHLIRLTLPVTSNLRFAAGANYWFTLQDATTLTGDPVYWDQNSGVGCRGWNGTGLGCPSRAVFTGLGSVPSESFVIYGNWD